VLRWAVSRHDRDFPLAQRPPVHHLLEVLARVNAETPIAKLRWSVAHLNDASPETLERLKAMGGWLLQNAFYFAASLPRPARAMPRGLVPPLPARCAESCRSAAAPTRTA